MGKRLAAVEPFEGNMGSMQREDSALYSKKGTSQPCKKELERIAENYGVRGCTYLLQGCNPSPYCESTAEEARAGNLQAGFREGCAPQGARLLDVSDN